MTEHPKPAHGRFGGSSIAGAKACPASAFMLGRVPASPDSKYAAEGAVAHALAEQALSKNLHPTHWLGEAVDPRYPGILVTQEMCDAVVVYMNAVLTEQAQTMTGELHVEKAFGLDAGRQLIDAAIEDEAEREHWYPFSRNDALVYHPETRKLVAFDYKHGVGVTVAEGNNMQLRYAVSGAVLGSPDWTVTDAEVVIVQPRSLDVDEIGAVRRVPMPADDIFEFIDEVELTIRRALLARKHLLGRTAASEGDVVLEDNGEPFRIFDKGEHCRWCDVGAAGICPIRDKDVLQAIETLDPKLAFAGVKDITPSALPEINAEYDPALLGRVLAGIEALSGWASQIRDYIHGQLQSGVSVPGWKLVEVQARRKWSAADEDVAGYLALAYDVPQDDLLPRKLVTITEAERLLKAALPADKLKEAKEDLTLRFTIKESSGVTLAPESDRRPAVDAIERAFGSVNTNGL